MRRKECTESQKGAVVFGVAGSGCENARRVGTAGTVLSPTGGSRRVESSRNQRGVRDGGPGVRPSAKGCGKRGQPIDLGVGMSSANAQGARCSSR